ncbi:hypothetical protein ACH79_28625 [Bradyrhizobium sp. CCBAU 051011]|uniref:hypothetical protein n=1 Tax=Bradyrhizobium sp. CCBAU 051011 TaxID=858422 RepID=UPI0013740402|nr:hypothetical protein [Bradyrhizobium sp. CCBAU 051011]QHO75985.1 hypothetical protein ACH79_28625 [Bradyrhizobium sp. CCBAU 051011]
MADQPNPNDPQRGGRSEEEIRRRDNELQADPQLAEGPASGGRIAVYAIAIAVVLGAVFYGLNNSTMNQAGTTPPSETAQQTQPANRTGPSGKTNADPGTTTGAATTNRPTPPSSNPTGTEVDRSKQ